MAPYSQNGFTLLELLVTLAVLGILLGIGAPDLTDAVRNGRIGAVHNALAGSMHLARSEAIKGSTVVTVCARGESASSCGESWDNGWLVFVDGGTVGSVDDDDTVLRVSGPLGGARTIRAIGSPDRTSASASARDRVSFGPRGGTDWKGGSFVICDDRAAAHARVVNLVLTGDARRGRKGADGGAPLNVFGQPVTCPAG